jgi:peroxiredoxin
MVATLCLLGCVLAPSQPPAPAQAPPRGDWLLTPRLTRSQEVLYRGTFSEEASGGQTQYSRSYRLDLRVFVLETGPKGSEVAFFTTLRPKDGKPGVSDGGAASVRLEVAQVGPEGRLAPAAGVGLLAPLEGVPTAEAGCFVEAPARQVAANQSWEAAEDGRPPRSWRVAGTEAVAGTVCVKLVGTQQSDDWDRPRADRTAWRRSDQAWLSPRSGLATRVERVVERRAPAHREPTYRSVTRYEMQSSMQYPGGMAEERRQEIGEARAFADAAAPLLAQPLQHTPAIDAQLKKLAFYTEHNPATPYRDAVLLVRRRLEAARKGEVPVALPDAAPERPRGLAVGDAAPDFLAADFGGDVPARLQRFAGRPVLLVFYHPSSQTAAEVLGFAEHLAMAYPGALHVVGLSMCDDAERVLKQKAELKLTLPLLHGSGLRLSYGVEATPRLVLLDASGFVRGAWTGWGSEAPEEIVAELRQWLGR